MYILSHIMVLFFDLETLEKQSGNDAQKMMALLAYHANKNLALKKSKYKPSKVSLFGHCFLLNFNSLLSDKSTDILFKIQYIKLAARRDYTLYKLYQYKNLQLSFYPDINYDSIKQNPLLNITKTEIHFKYEDT